MRVPGYSVKEKVKPTPSRESVYSLVVNKVYYHIDYGCFAGEIFDIRWFLKEVINEETT